MSSDSISVPELRARLTAARRALSPEECSQAARAVRERFAAWAQAHPQAAPHAGQVAALYCAHTEWRELDLAPLAEWLSTRGVKLAYPRIAGRGTEYVFAFAKQASDFEPGPWKVLQPHAQAEACELSAIDWIFVPGVGFSPTGGRIGMGQGHYDRLLPRLRPDCRRLGVCHEVQIVAELPQESWDQPMHALLSPRGLKVIQKGFV